MKQLLTLLLLTTLTIHNLSAQTWMQLHQTIYDYPFTLPVKTEGGVTTQFSSDEELITIQLPRTDTTPLQLPFYMGELDSITFSPSLLDSEKGHNRYRPFTMNILTADSREVEERDEWIDCIITIDGRGEYSNYCGTGRIRGRGNSSWDWYDKKPYKIKLDSKSKLLGLEKAKNWNLLANYRDPTDMMNTFAFELARNIGLPYTNHTRYVELLLNGEYIGLYQLTEKIEIHENRINIPSQGPLLLSFDQDDGPDLSPEAGDNFTSKVFALPMCVKEPENLTQQQIDSIRDEFALLERAIRSRDITKVAELLDLPSFISILQLHELLYNVEIDAPRSIYIHKAPDGRYTFGPVWDWDGGYDFDWSQMYQSHTFFTDYRELIYGTDPVNHTDANYIINEFWRTLFGNRTFMQQYKQAWQAITDDIITQSWDETQRYAETLQAEGAYTRDCLRWPLVSETTDWWGNVTGRTTYTPSAELTKMQRWIRNRKTYLDNIVANYPEGNDEILPLEYEVNGTIEKTQTIVFANGYTQSAAITINSSEVRAILGGTPTSLVPLNSDGEEGSNTAAGTYGAWFDSDGNTNAWASGHVYIESDSLYSWSYGCHPANCSRGDRHVVTMQYRLGNKAVNVRITFLLA